MLYTVMLEYQMVFKPSHIHLNQVYNHNEQWSKQAHFFYVWIIPILELWHKLVHFCFWEFVARFTLESSFEIKPAGF